MLGESKSLFLVIVLIGLGAGSAALGQSRYTTELLNVKRIFSEMENAALARPFKGVSAADGFATDLFPIRTTGVSTAPILHAAKNFLGSLTPQQLIKTQYSVDDSEWRKWSNVDNGIYVRQGVSLEEMSTVQKEAAIDLLSASLSAKGLDLSFDIMKTDQTLRELNDDAFVYGEEKYFFTVMGVPNATEPWGWQLDGHHLIINYFVMGDQVVVTPMFLGGEPIVTKTGMYAGNQVLQDEQNQGLALVQALNSEQHKIAVLDSNKSANNLRAQAGKDNLVLNYEGIAAADLLDDQKIQLVDLIKLFVNNIRPDQAKIRMEEVLQHLDDTYFAWIGGSTNDAVFYYRIHSPVILIEFDHQRPVGNPYPMRNKPTRQHIHIMVRTPNGNDYGKDLLRQHLDTHKH
ncbi:MAG: hypothetical protein ACI96M_001164 [Candidatus Azotimanducaceae bacterium]|jgi:hypothetical protein